MPLHRRPHRDHQSLMPPSNLPRETATHNILMQLPMYELRYKRLVARKEYQLQHGVPQRVRNALRRGLGRDILGDTSQLFMGDVDRVALILERAVFR